MTTDYTPRAGSKAESAIAALEAHGPLTHTELADLIDCAPDAVRANLAIAMKHGVIARVYGQDERMRFALPDQEEVAKKMGELPAETASVKAKAPPPPAPKPAPAPAPAPAKQRALTKPTSRRPVGAPVRIEPLAEGCGSVRAAVLDTGEIALLDGATVTHTFSAAQAQRIAALVSRLQLEQR